MQGPYGGQVDNRAAFNTARNPTGIPVRVSGGS
jgi:hypothetical protein